MNIQDWFLSQGYIRIDFLLYGRMEEEFELTTKGFIRQIVMKTYNFDDLNLQWVKSYGC